MGLIKPILIIPDMLKDLYEKRKLSETEIAKRLGCSRHVIETRMKLYDIKPRSYRESNTKYPKTDFSGNLFEKAYLIGFRLGDLSVDRRRFLIHVGCSTTLEPQVDLIKKLFSPYTFVYTKPSRILKGKWVIDIQCLLNDSFQFLLPKKDIIENWILKNDTCFCAFLAGYIDAEGHIFTRLQKKSITPFSGLEIQTYDKTILHQTWEKLNRLGIECPRPLLNKPAGYVSKSGIINNGDCWRLSITKKKSLNQLFEKIYPFIKHQKRRNDLEEAWQNTRLRLCLT